MFRTLTAAVALVLVVAVVNAAARSSHHHHPHRPASRAPPALPKFDVGQYELLNYDPVANPDAVVVSGNARFTVLTARVIRIEWSDSGVFEDRATLAIVNRNVTLVHYIQSVANGVLTILTSELVLTYTVGQPFSSTTLGIAVAPEATGAGTGLGLMSPWTYGETNSGTRNLLGTVKSLDELDVIPLNCTENANIIVHDELLHCEWALMSRDGWALIDDHTNYALDPATYWWDGLNTDAVDLYFFGHGLDYKAALNDFVQIGGRVAMVPKYASGIWWSRWLNLNQFDTRQIVETYESLALPLDVFILDMDWHTKESWGAYSWDNRIFPVPTDAMGYLAHRGLPVGVNLHDADGVQTFESEFQAMAVALGLNPQTCGNIPFSMVNSSYVYALEDIVLHAVDKAGVDFYWIDWQQGGQQGGCSGDKQNPTIWTDRIRCTDHLRRGENTRGITLARWGGLGTHRYQVGFSGDVSNLDWTDLAFQPYYSLTSSNVAYGFWSHDLVGPWNDHELHTRWLQWGAYSGVFRTHDRGMSSGGCADSGTCAIVEVWKTPFVYFSAIRSAMQARAQLLPMLYTAARTAFDTGLTPLRPMYYEFPLADMAYAGNSSAYGQYFFCGSDMFVAPVVVPVSQDTMMATTNVWVPPGQWIEKETGVLHDTSASGAQGAILTKAYDLSEVPVFVRAGAVVATVPFVTGQSIGRASQQYSALVFTVYGVSSSASSGSTIVYEDDGATVNYLQGMAAWTTASWYSANNNQQFTFDVVCNELGYPERPAARALSLRWVNLYPPTSVTVNGVSIPYSRWGGAMTWTFDGVDSAVVIDMGMQPTVSTTTVVLNLPVSQTPQTLSGLRGGVRHGILSKQNLDVTQQTPGCNSVAGGALDALASFGDYLAYLAGTNPSAFSSAVQGYAQSFQAAVTEVGSMTGVSPVRWAYSKALLANVFVTPSPV